MLHVQSLQGQGEEEEEKHARTQRPVDCLPGTQMNVRTKTDAGRQPHSDSVSMVTLHLSLTWVHTLAANCCRRHVSAGQHMLIGSQKACVYRQTGS